MQVRDMALEVVWVLTAFIILATIFIGVFKGGLADNVLFARGPQDFLLDRLARYGDPFTISLMGKTYTVLSSSETIKFVLSTAHASFSDAYPEPHTRLLSPERVSSNTRAQLRKIILSAASGDGLQNLVPFISSLAEKSVKSWEHQAVVDPVEESEKFAFIVAMHIIWRDVEPGSEEMDDIRNEITHVVTGLAVLPINLPGFSFQKALKAKQVLVSRILSTVSRRRKTGIHQDDILNTLTSFGENKVSDDDACSVMVGLMLAAAMTTAALIPWVLKYLDDYPEVCQRVQEEQDCIRQKMIEDKSLTWFKPKSSMPYTLQVIYEILRIETILLLLPRKVSKDIDYNGLFLHKGSYVWPATSSLHHDPKYYPNSREFDPSRFVEKPKINAFMAFGQGPHSCPGSELALTETLFIIHHLVTNYSWKRCGPHKGVIQLPVKKLIGFPIRLVKRDLT